MNKNIMPFVSVVIPTYNHANYLKKALQSLLDQTYKDWEAIVIDNHSIDNTQQVVKKFRDSRIKYLKINNHGVIAKSRNEGIKNSKGEWIAFLDSDDWWTSDKLKNCIENVNYQVDLIYHDLEIVSSKQKIFRRKLIKTRQLRKPILIDLLISGNLISNSSVIVRREILEKIDLIDESRELVASEDYNTWLKISNLTDQFLYLPKKLGYYFSHDQNISKKDMSLSYRQATYEFLPVLNNKQKIMYETNIKYMLGKFNFFNSNYNKARQNLLFVIKNGNFKLKVKSLIIIILTLISPT